MKPLLTLLLVAAGCAAPPPPSQKGGAQEELRRAREEVRRLRRERDTQREELERLRKQLERQRSIVQVARSLERIRGLPIRRPLRVRFVEQAWARRHMEQELERDAPAGYLEGYVATLARVGLLPPRYPLRKELLELMSEQVAGFYDPRAGALFVRRDMPAGELILSHEIAHALQDQSFPLQPLHGEEKDQEDRSFAVRALVEGDATLTMVEHLRRTMTLWKAFRLLPDLLEAMALDDARLKQAPAYIRESLVQPYLRGMAFVQVLHGRGGWKRVDQAFRAPPVSSEQVLHPEKYLAGELPEPVTLPDLSGLLGEAVHENTLGEFGVSVLLGQTVGSSAAARAAAGWAGDRLRSYRRPDGELVLVWVTLWDSIEDARELQRALTDHLNVRYARRGAVWTSGHGVAATRMRGRRVVIVDGAQDERQARALLARCR